MSRLALLIAATLVAVPISAQQPPAASPDKPAAVRELSAADVEKLTREISAAYYHPEALAGLDCNVQVDWEPFMTALKVDLDSDGGKKELAILRGLKLHAHAMRGKPAELTFNWAGGDTPAKDQIEGGLRQTVAGFFQSYWGMFDMADVKASDVTKAEAHADSSSTLYTGDANSQLVVDVDKEGTPTHYKVKSPALNATIDLEYTPTLPPTPGDTRRITTARIAQFAGETTIKVNMKLDYQPAGTFFVPHRANFDIPGALSIGFEFTSCTAVSSAPGK